jgi:hypothetical protein
VTQSGQAAGEDATAPIFIVGSGRSGTALLARMLCAHPRIYICNELGFYFLHFLLPSKADGNDWLRYFMRTLFVRRLRLNPDQVRASLPQHLPRNQAHLILREVMRRKAARHGRVRYGDQTPAYVYFLDKLFADFPRARVICVVRDPRSTVYSLYRMPFAPASIISNCLQYERATAQALRHRHRILIVRLEDLVAQPRRVMQRVLAYAGEEWDERVLDHASHQPDAGEALPLPWQSQALEARLPRPNDWQDMPALHRAVVESLCRRSIRLFRYPAPPAAARPSIPALTAFAVQDLAAGLRSWWYLARLALHSRDVANLNDAETFRLFSKINPRAMALYPGLTMPRFPPPLDD